MEHIFFLFAFGLHPVRPRDDSWLGAVGGVKGGDAVCGLNPACKPHVFLLWFLNCIALGSLDWRLLDNNDLSSTDLGPLIYHCSLII